MATIFLTWCFNTTAMDVCGVRSPDVRDWLVVIAGLQWGYLVFAWVVRPLARAYSNRRHLLHAPLRAPAATEAPAFVQPVCFVPSADEWKGPGPGPGPALPHPPVVLDADNAECPICYDEFPPPSTNIVTKTVSAPTLWRTRCGHVFHDSCLLEWLRSSGGTTCPYCNQDAATAPARCHEPGPSHSASASAPPAGPPPAA